MFLWNIDTYLPEYTVSRPKVPQYGKRRFLNVKAGTIYGAVFVSYISSSYFLMGYQAVESAMFKWGYYY